MSHILAELPAPDVAARLAAGAAVLLPMASTETHGPGAPMGDYLLTDGVARRIAEEAAGLGVDALVAPVLPFGGEDYFSSVPGCIALSPKLLQALVEEMLEGLVRQGVKRIMVVNGHGGSITAVEAATRQLRRRHGMMVPTFHLWRNAHALHKELGGNPAASGHGGDPIWSVLLHLRPDLAQPAKLQPRRDPPPAWGLPVVGFGLVKCGGADFSLPLDVEETAPGGNAAVEPAGGSAEFGARLVGRLASAGAQMLKTLAEHTA